MLETVGDIWEYAGRAVIVITASGTLTRDGRAVLGRGVARQAGERFTGLAAILGRLVARQGSRVFDLGNGLVSFPVEETAWSQPDLRIIASSARQLRELVDLKEWKRIVVPRPGCGGGGLAWKDVRPLLEPWFDGRFIIIALQQ